MSNGIESVVPDEGEFGRLQKVMTENNYAMAKQGIFSLELFQKMQDYIVEYRRGQADNKKATATEATVADAMATGSR